MNGSTVNSSSSVSAYLWSECDPYDDGAGKSGGPSAGFLILEILYCFEFLVGAPSNLWLIHHIFRRRSKVAGVLPADFFPLHLTISQLTFLIAMPSFFANHFLWRSADVLSVVRFLTSMVFTMKPLLLCLVCVERYVAVVRPLDYLRFKKPRYRWACLGVSWGIYLILASSAMFRGSLGILFLVLPPVLVINTFCSLSVLKALKKPPPGDSEVTEKKRKKGDKERKTHNNRSRAVRMEEGEQRKEGRAEEKVKRVESSSPRGKGKMTSMKKTAFFTIAIIQVVLSLNYLPLMISFTIGGLFPARVMKCQYLTVGLAAAASCSYLQPLFYLHRLGMHSGTSQNT